MIQRMGQFYWLHDSKVFGRNEWELTEKYHLHIIWLYNNNSYVSIQQVKQIVLTSP